ncbi:hypothetical protein DFH27DRAFT_525592 [Peziza echinospora]|nr:hypothetical protein DFH27DRAFT_525592 [Peziza echinospora]
MAMLQYRDWRCRSLAGWEFPQPVAWAPSHTCSRSHPGVQLQCGVLETALTQRQTPAPSHSTRTHESRDPARLFPRAPGTHSPHSQPGRPAPQARPAPDERSRLHSNLRPRRHAMDCQWSGGEVSKLLSRAPQNSRQPSPTTTTTTTTTTAECTKTCAPAHLSVHLGHHFPPHNLRGRMWCKPVASPPVLQACPMYRPRHHTPLSGKWRYLAPASRLMDRQSALACLTGNH